MSLAESVPSSYQTSALDQAVEKLWHAGRRGRHDLGQPRAEHGLLRAGQRPVRDHGRRLRLERHASTDRRRRRELLVLRRHRRRLRQAGDRRHRAGTSSRTSRRARRSTTRRPTRTTSSRATSWRTARPSPPRRSPAPPRSCCSATRTLTPNQIKWLLAGTGRPVTRQQRAGRSTSPLRSPTTARSRPPTRASWLGRRCHGRRQQHRAELGLEQGRASPSSALHRSTRHPRPGTRPPTRGSTAGDIWSRADAPIAAATAYDRAGGDYARAGASTRPRRHGRPPPAQLDKSLVEWSPVALELSARAWMAPVRTRTARS